MQHAEANAVAQQSADEKLREAKRSVTADPCYPKYHVAPPVGWMNDPHPIYFKGAYHIFYQYSWRPDDPYRGPHSWGHAMSRDLIRWQHMPVALTPTNHGISADQHIWSGCLVDNGGIGTAIYTIDNMDIFVSTSNDDNLAAFLRHPDNPVIKGPPPGLELFNGMRDPWVWKEADGWYLIVGAIKKGGEKEYVAHGTSAGAAFPLYKSPDLIHWQYLHPLYEDNKSVHECPAFFPLGDKHVLVVTNPDHSYLIGRYENHRFIAEHSGKLDYGSHNHTNKGCFYVPQFVLDGKDRRIMWGWVMEPGAGITVGWGDHDSMRRNGWSGMQTLPRVVSLHPDGGLAYEPAEELEKLRRDHYSFAGIALPAGVSHVLEGVHGGQLEIRAVFEPSATGAVGLALLDGDRRTEFVYDAETKSLRSLNSAGPLELAPGEALELRIFVDGSVVEVFANRRACLTERIYPAPSNLDALRVALITSGAPAMASKVDVWKMDSIWTDSEGVRP